MEKNTETILYDNTRDYEKYDEIRQCLFNEFADYQDWLLPSDVPEKMIQEEIATLNSNDWEYLEYKLKEMFKSGYYLLTGICGRWNGPQNGGKFINSYGELMRCIEHLDGLKVSDNNGHLFFDGYHHDGHDHYELKKLTQKGYDYAESNYFSNCRKVHQTIFNNNFFSCLPRLAAL